MKRSSSNQNTKKLQSQLDAISLRHCKKRLENLSRNIPEEKITARILFAVQNQCKQNRINDLNDFMLEDFKECIYHLHKRGVENPSDVKERTALLKNIKRLDQFFEPYSEIEITPAVLGLDREYDVICPHCGSKAELTPSTEVSRNDYGNVYLCRGCGAYCGTHPGTNIPKGLPATEDERRYRKYVHSLFDQLWKQYGWDRHNAYVWLSRQMDLPFDETHIGLFSIKQCKKALAVVHAWLEKPEGLVG